MTVWLVIALFVYSYSNYRNLYSLQRYLYMPSVPWFILICYLGTRIERAWLKYLSLIPILVVTCGYSLYLILEGR